jgi:hypothetical protein
MADPTYLDRLYDEIGQYGDRVRNTIFEPDRRVFLNKIISNWTTPYETPERRQEAMRLAAQQTKEQYMAQQNAGQLSLEDATESQAIREAIGKQLYYLKPDTAYLTEQERLRMQAVKEGYMAQQEAARPTEQYEQPSVSGLDPYIQYLEENKELLKNPEYAAPTREEFNQYFVNRQAPPKATLDPYTEYLRQNETLLMGPQGQYAAPTREEYQKHFVEGQAPPRAVAVPPAVAEMAAAMPMQPQPRNIPTLSEVPQEAIAAQQPGQQRGMTIRDQIAALPYEADRLEATRKVIDQARTKTFNDGLKYIADTYGDIGLPAAVNARQTLEKSIDVNLPLPKPVEESAQYKAAEKNWDGGLRDRQKRLVSAYNVVQKSQALMDKDPNEALLFMRAAMAKPLQSIISSDAIQVSEMLIQYQDLLNAPAFAQLTGKQPTNPAILFNKYLSLDEKEQGAFFNRLVSAMVEANPQRALKNAIYTVNSYVDGYNKDIGDQVVFPTSPAIAKRFGAVQFKPLENRQSQNELPDTYPQAGVSVPAQQKSAVPLDIEAMRSRYKR